MSIPFVIASFGASHEGVLSNAVQGIQAAKRAGATAFSVPFWSDPKRMRTRRHVDEPSTRFDVESARPEWLGYLKNGTRGQELLFAVEVSLPEDVAAVSAYADVFVVGSYEARDRELTRAISAARGERPFFLATGMQDGREDMALPPEAITLHTVESTPCPLEQANLGAIEAHEGYADRTRSIFTGGLAVMAGADYLFVTYRLGHTAQACADYLVALSPEQLTKYVWFAREAADARGAGEKTVMASERENLRYRVVR